MEVVIKAMLLFREKIPNPRRGVYFLTGRQTTPPMVILWGVDRQLFDSEIYV